MSRHTPGPWVATRDEHAPKAYRITGADTLLTTGSKYVRTIALVKGGAPAAANAQLLAAAPELLDLVALAVAGTEADDEVWLGHAWVRAARAAIAKAGGAP